MNSRLKVKFRWSAVEFHGWPLKCENIESHADLASSDCRDKNVVKKWLIHEKMNIGNLKSEILNRKLKLAISNS